MWTLFSAIGREIDVERCLIMGIVNATPDSFSDGGLLAEAPDLVARMQALVDAGADILDIGGESTRPGAEPVSIEEELERVIPVVHAARETGDVWISIDTSKPEVAAAALDAGADFINDVTGLGDAAMGRIAARRGCSVVLMRHAECHGDIVTSAREQLRAHAVRARAAGIASPQIILDPGLGFGKRPGPHPEDNLALVDAIETLSMGQPMLIGASRKRFIGAMSGIEEASERDVPSIEVALRARDAGAAIVRVHDVEGTVQAFLD